MSNVGWVPGPVTDGSRLNYEKIYQSLINLFSQKLLAGGGGGGGGE
jgi:hypothetical protein